MEERLVDVLNDRNTVLHVFHVAVERPDAAPKDFEQAALKAAIAQRLVPETEAEKLRARIHVCRGGPLTPYADALQIKREQKERRERSIRERAYFLWLEDGCAENRADEHWHRARELEGASED